MPDTASSEIVKTFTIPIPYFRDEISGQKQFSLPITMDELFMGGLVEKGQLKSKAAEFKFYVKDITSPLNLMSEFPNYGNNEDEV